MLLSQEGLAYTVTPLQSMTALDCLYYQQKAKVVHSHNALNKYCTSLNKSISL